MRRLSAVAIFVVGAGGCGELLSTSPEQPGTDAGTDGGSPGSSESGADARVGDGAVEASTPCTSILTQPDHCGACGHSCLGGACSNGLCQPVVLATGQPDPLGIGVDDTYVYWTTHVSLTGAVMRAPKASVATVTADVFEGSQDGAHALAVAGGKVYWSTDGDGSGGGPGAMKCEEASKNGGPNVLANQNQTTAIFVSPTAVMWAVASNGTQDQGAIRLAPLGLGSPVIEKVGSSSQTSGFTITSPSALAADGSYVYYGAGIMTGYVRRAGLMASANETNMTGTNPFVHAVALLGSYVYWTSDAGLRRTPSGGIFTSAAIESVTAQGDKAVGLVAAEKEKALYVVLEAGDVYRTDGTSLLKLAKGPAGARLLAQDDAALYWIATPVAGSAWIMKLAKPPK